ncbi:MAG TPA: pitrilysin family protein [Gemmatimonadales bacterium]|nr:pitrilysin family protein [Gemmatimonadales bacterium]
MRSILRTAVVGLAGFALPLAHAQNPAARALSIPFEHYVLPNGLQVILSVNRTIPQASVDVWYHVGSKNEVPGRTGFAHLFEHVMFTGSGHVPYGMHDRLTEGVGGNNNGSTTNDRTNYWENVPSNYVESALWLESDRMGFLLDKLDDAKFVAQRDVVQNERRQGVDNQPYGRAFEILTTALLPDTHPYSWPIVGYIADLQKATVDDVKQFFRLYYAPSNATLTIVGDFDPAQVKQWVSKYFGGLPRGAPITRPAAPAPPPAGKRMVFEDRVQVPRLYLAWNAAGEDSEDSAALDLLADVLSGPRTARLTKALVFDQQSAANVAAFHSSGELHGTLVISLTPRPGHSLSELEASTDSILERLKQDGPSVDELARAIAGTEFRFVSGLESNLGKAETLAAGQVFHRDPAWYQKEYANLKATTATDIRRVANKYLTGSRAVLSIVPVGKPGDASHAEQSIKVTVSPDGGHYLMGGN